jgi:hypothetical protein
LPVGIFENTPEPIGEEEKERLLDYGYTSNWVILHNDADSLDLAAMKRKKQPLTDITTMGSAPVCRQTRKARFCEGGLNSSLAPRAKLTPAAGTRQTGALPKFDYEIRSRHGFGRCNRPVMKADL